MELMSVVLYCVLLMHVMLETQASWTPCSPSDSSVQCDISDDENKCAEHEDEFDNIPVITEPILFPPQLVPIPGSQHNGIIFQWRSPSAQALNSTTGFLITLYRFSPNQTKELCLYANVSSSKSIVDISDPEVVFRYEIDKLEGIDTQYFLAFVTLPKSSKQGFDVGTKIFRTDSSINPTTTTTAAPPVDYESIMDLSADDSVPYKVNGSFRRAAHYPNLIAQELYNFSSYRVVLLDVNSARVRAGIFDNSTFTELTSIERLGPEYITFTFEDLIPGSYQVQVWPMSFCHYRDSNCYPFPDKQYKKEPVSVRGTDYRPSSPDLMVFQSNDVTVQFEIAPKSHYITSYYVKLYKPGVDSNVTEVLPHPNATDSWYLYSYNVSSDEVLAYFEPGDSITAEVIQQQHSRLCIEKGQCNLNGTCTPCTPSISQQQTLVKEPATTTTVSLRTADIGQWVAIIVTAVVLVLAIVVAVVMCWRKQIGITDVIKLFPQKCRDKPERDGKITVCMAHAPLSEYREFNCHLRSVLENYFHCEVDVYTGDPTDTKYKSCDYVVVVFSPKLLQAYRFLDKKPGVIPEDQKRRKAVLDILLNPQSTPSPAVLFVAFDNIPLRQVNELVTRNSSLKVFRLPSDLRLLVTELHHESSGLSYNESMRYFEESPLKEGIDKAINEINDSGLGDDTMTVNTEAQHDDRFGCHAGDNYTYDSSRFHTTTPRAAEQQFLPNRLDSETLTGLPSEPAAFPMLPDVSNTACVEMEVLYNNVQQPNHTVLDETKPPDRNISVDSGSDCRGISVVCESIPSSEPEDSFQLSSYRTSMFPDSMLPAVYKTSETVDTIEC